MPGPRAHCFLWLRPPLAWAMLLPPPFLSRPHPNSALHGVQAESWSQGWQEIWGLGDSEPGGPLASTKLLSPSAPHPGHAQERDSSIQLGSLGVTWCPARVRAGPQMNKMAKTVFPRCHSQAPRGSGSPQACMSQDRWTRLGPSGRSVRAEEPVSVRGECEAALELPVLTPSPPARDRPWGWGPWCGGPLVSVVARPGLSHMSLDSAGLRNFLPSLCV